MLSCLIRYLLFALVISAWLRQMEVVVAQTGLVIVNVGALHELKI